MFLEKLDAIDRQITLAINSLNSPFTDKIWEVFSHVQIWFVMYAIVLGCIYWRIGLKKALVFTAALVLCVVTCDQIANLFKEGCQRLRPCNDTWMIEHGLHVIHQGGLYGFFSGHACNAFGFACCSLIALRTDKRLKYRGYAAWIFIWAVLVSISRVFVSMHFFGDIFCGAIAGTLIGLLWGFIARFAANRMISRS